ncbi:MAG: EF-hand domain-containing protein [archaeon]|nr:EF-hand domain-containing protein [archaeon]
MMKTCGHCSCCTGGNPCKYCLYCYCHPYPKKKDVLGSSYSTNSMGSSMYNSGTGTNFGSTNLRSSGSPMRGSSNEIRRVSPNLALRASPERRFSPCRRTQSPMRSSSPFNGSGTYSTNQSNNLRSIRNNDGEEEKNKLLNYFTSVMNAEGDLERDKTILAMKGDFNVEDAFRIFEVDGRGYLTEDDLIEGLGLLEVPCTQRDARMLMKRFDNSKQGVLNYADFFDIVTPFEADYRNRVEERPPNSCCCCKCPGVFTCPTRIGLKNLFTSILDYERRLNETKKDMTMVRARMPTLYREIDRYNFGYFKEDDLKDYLRKNYALTSDKDKDLLFIRLDKNRNGKIEAYEVEDELTPQY